MTIERRAVVMTIARYAIDAQLDLEHARWLRGAFTGAVDRAEVHHHGVEGLVYQHPLVRFDVSTGVPVVAGLAEGALILRSARPLSELRLGSHVHPILGFERTDERAEIGPTSDALQYTFRSPYLALNQDNHDAWSRGSPADRRRLLERVVVGNLLSLSKAIGLHVGERLQAEVELEPDGWHVLKPGVRLLGFRGAFRVNFLIPDLWGLGKSSARGFGTVIRSEEP